MLYVEAIKDSLENILTSDERYYLLGEDICDPFGGAFCATKGLSSAFPGRVINTPLSESVLISVGTGMALRGLRPIVEIMFSDFLTLCSDQLLNHSSKFSWMYNMEQGLPLVIRTASGGRKGYGPTHSQCMERLFFGWQGIDIVSPSLVSDMNSLYGKVAGEDKIILMAEHKGLYGKKMLDKTSDPFFSYRSHDTGGYETHFISLNGFKAADMTILTYGGMLEYAMEAALKAACDEEIFCEIVIPDKIYPFGIEALKEPLQRSKRLLIAEEGQGSYGWGSEISFAVNRDHHSLLKIPVERVAALDLPIGYSGEYEENTLPGSRSIYEKVLKGFLR